MHEYDTVLKALLQSPQNTILERITGSRIDHWLNVEFPEVQQTRVDLLGETADLMRLIALELQSTNDLNAPLRMAEYSLRIYRKYGRFPDQYLLYVGNAAMRMASELKGPRFYCAFELIDIRTVDEEVLLSSPFDADHILAILTRHRDRRETIRRILARIATMEGSSRENAFRKLIILAGLRELHDTVRTEAKHMPILNDIMEHGIIGPAIREGLQKGLEQGIQQGMQQGMQKGIQQGLQQGMQKGELTILRRLIGRRFGSLPGWLEEHLVKLSTGELEEISLRLLDAKDIDELFRR
jgi:predicted transposase YdaD